MLGGATTAKEILLKQGLAAALLDDLAKALDRFEAEGNAINLSRRAHIGGRVPLGAWWPIPPDPETRPLPPTPGSTRAA